MRGERSFQDRSNLLHSKIENEKGESLVFVLIMHYEHCALIDDRPNNKRERKTTTKITSLSFVIHMATSVRMHRTCPKYFLDLPPRTLVTPKIIRTIAPPQDDALSSSSTTALEEGGNTTPGSDGAANRSKNGGHFPTNYVGAVARNHAPAPQFHANQVVPLLWLGSHADSFCPDELRQHGIFHVLNVAVECITPETLATTEEGKRPIRVKHVLLEDHSDENISASFAECSAFINDAIENRREGVLVHCRMGVSRSATIVIAYLMEHGKRYQQWHQQQQQQQQQLQQGHCTSWENLCSPMVLADHPDLFQSGNDVPFSCGVTPSTSASTSAATSASSSPSITTEWLPYSDAFDMVKAARPEISPNLGFCIALRELDVRHNVAKEDSWEFACIGK